MIVRHSHAAICTQVRFSQCYAYAGYLGVSYGHRGTEKENEKGFLPVLTANLDMRALITGYVSVGLVEIRLNRHCPNGLQPLVGG